MFLNPLYYSLHYDDPISGRKMETYGIRMFDESIDPIFDIQTLNLKLGIFNPINAFSIRCKDHLVGWHVLQDCNRLFWVFIGHFPSPYASIGWSVRNISLRKVFQVMSPVCKENDAFLYAKCHLT